MLRLCIKPSTFEILDIQEYQNPYINPKNNVSHKTVMKEHHDLEKAFKNIISYTVTPDTTEFKEKIPDIVFVANAGLCLPRIPKTVLLPYMKYAQRKRELKYLKEIFEDLDLNTIPFPGSQSAPFEGQAEIKWFHGGMLGIGGYGHRSTKKSFEILEKLLNKVYKSHKLVPPVIVPLHLLSADYYHLDVAMLEFDDSKCIVHKHAFSNTSINILKKLLGDDNVFVINTPDHFCLNAVVDGKNLITHKITTKNLKETLEDITNLKIKQVDTKEFEKSGGSVRCMTLDIY